HSPAYIPSQNFLKSNDAIGSSITLSRVLYFLRSRVDGESDCDRLGLPFFTFPKSVNEDALFNIKEFFRVRGDRGEQGAEWGDRGDLGEVGDVPLDLQIAGDRGLISIDSLSSSLNLYK